MDLHKTHKPDFLQARRFEFAYSRGGQKNQEEGRGRLTINLFEIKTPQV
jgi:hypothetical protein